jgi:hypothetical protein
VISYSTSHTCLLRLEDPCADALEVKNLVARVAAPNLVLAAHVVKADDALVRVVLETFADQVDERRHGVALQNIGQDAVGLTTTGRAPQRCTIGIRNVRKYTELVDQKWT